MKNNVEKAHESIEITTIFLSIILINKYTFFDCSLHFYQTRNKENLFLPGK
jgi:hypothetical protein